MGMVSSREDNNERANASLFEHEGGLRASAFRAIDPPYFVHDVRQYQEYLKFGRDAKARREAKELFGRPFAQAVREVRQFANRYESETRVFRQVLAGWAELEERLAQLEEHLREAVLPETGADALRRLERQIRSLCQRSAWVGPVRVDLVRFLLRELRAWRERRSTMVDAIQSFLNFVDRLPHNDEERELLGSLVETLEAIEISLEEQWGTANQLYRQAKRIEALWKPFLSGYRTAMVRAGDRVELEHLNRLLLEPEQERHVRSDRVGHARLLGVSGSGKTIILIHRALRLAWMHPYERIGVLTLSRSLAHMLASAARVVHGGAPPANLEFKSVYDVALDCLRELDPDTLALLHDEKSSEDLTRSWDDFTSHAGRSVDTNVLVQPDVSALVRTLEQRLGGVPAALDYLRDEIRFVQSAFSPEDRGRYLDTTRHGRSIRFGSRQRAACLSVVNGWEEYLRQGGLCDPEEAAGLVEDLFDRAETDRLEPLQFDKLLVDECQDLSTLELRLLRSLVKDPESTNALFFTGDHQQRVTCREHSFARAGLDLTGRSQTLRRNFRNTRPILEAAHQLVKAYPVQLEEAVEVLEPKHSRYDSPKPVVLRCSSTSHEDIVFHALNAHSGKRRALLCEDEGTRLIVAERLRRAGATVTDILPNDLSFRASGPIPDATGPGVYIGDFAAAKGFEFDVVFLAGFSDGRFPSRSLPEEEWYRAASVAYVAMTRARELLLISFVGKPSPLMGHLRDTVDHRRCDSASAVASLITLAP